MGFKTSLRTRITVGLLFLLGIIILISGVGVFYLTQLSDESDKLLDDNYLSVIYLRHLYENYQELPAMQSKYTAGMGINKPDYRNRKKEVLIYLDSLRQNSNDKEETRYIDSLNLNFIRYVSHFDEILEDTNLVVPNMEIYFNDLRNYMLPVRENITKIRKINQEQIFKRNDTIQRGTEEALLYMAIIGGVCVLITVGFIFYFPIYLTKPLNDLYLAFEQMSQKNYKIRLHVGSTDEFARLAVAFNKMSKKIAEFEDSNLGKLLIEKRRTEAIIEHLQDGIIGVSGQNKIIFLNQVAEILLDMSSDEAVDRYIPDLLPNSDTLYAIMVDLMESEKGQLIPEKTVKIPSSDRDLFFSRQVMTLPETDTMEGFIVVLKNVTKFTEMDAAKTHFIATISHELKTPLAATRLSLGLLRDKRLGELNEDQADLVGDIEQATERLFALTGEILQLSQIEAGKTKISLQPIEVDEIVSYSLQAIRIAAEQKFVTVKADISQELPIFFADIDKIKWVTINFLSNAIRYAPQKSEVKLKIYEEGGGIIFSVTDNGKGIAEMYHLKIFEKYFQVPEEEENNENKGSGLGLAICREFIEAHRGEIWVESKEGQGATFFFWLPINRRN